MNREDLPAGPLRNGNPRGNPNSAPRCGARNRAGNACRAPAMANGRCRCHGGASTGPRSAAGLAALRAARTVHGFYGADGIAFRHTITMLLTEGKRLRRMAEADATSPPRSRPRRALPRAPVLSRPQDPPAAPRAR